VSVVPWIGSVYIVGGERPAGITAVTEVFDMANTSYPRIGPPLLFKRRQLGVASGNGAFAGRRMRFGSHMRAAPAGLIFALGGVNDTGAMSTVERLDVRGFGLSGANWTLLPSMSTTRYGMGSVFLAQTGELHSVFVM
jgi:hypothetical protein